MLLIVSVLAVVFLLTNVDAEDEYYSGDRYQHSYAYQNDPEEIHHGGESSRRIMGGNTTEITQWPSALKMTARPLFGKVSHCGAVIINTNWALTAAHCISGAKPSEITVRAGSTHSGEGGSLHQIKEYVIHDKYKINKRLPVYDIALLRVTKPFKLTSPGVGAAHLPEAKDRVPVGSVAMKLGWGYFMNPMTNLSPVLRVADSFVISNEECAKQGLQVDYYNFCTADLCAQQKRTMPGDAGGPVFVGGILYGVHTSAVKNKSLLRPDKHIHIPHFREWIASISGV